jgi:GT2 family glycosyltransferase
MQRIEIIIISERKLDSSIKYSLIIPTFGRPDEVDEFLESLTHQRFKNFEVIIADGTPKKSLEEVANKYKGQVNFTFLYEEYLPVSDARNLGAQKAKGEYFIFLDSDCIIPPQYLEEVDKVLTEKNYDLFGGPDAADTSFTPVQKAISYSMTSLFTTGGIRGKKNHVGVFHPRGFNMGIRREAFEKVNGYDVNFKCGEDIDLSIRILKQGFKSGLISEAYVYHKRRTDFKKFYKQVFRFGAARINLFTRHKTELKITHLFPAVFLSYVSLGWVLFFVHLYAGIAWVASMALYKLLIWIDSALQNKSVYIGFLSVRAAFTQLCGYGWGFIRNGLEVFVKGNKKGLKL